MQIQNALITGSFSYNGADLSNITSSNAYSASLSIRTTNLESTASSLVGASSSFSERTTQVERTYASTGSNTFTGVQNFSNTCNPIGFNSVASVYTAGGLQVTYDSYFSSSVFVNGNLTVFGTQSVVHVSSSQFNIGTNIITVNTSTPSIRYGGLSVYDSGSTGLSGSIFWDSEANHWIYANASGSGGGSTYSGGMFISGPRSSGLGCEQGTTACRLLVGQGGDHLTSSMIYHDSTRTCFYSNALYVTSSGAVGIGTSTPSYQLEILNPSSDPSAGLFRCSNGVGVGIGRFYSSGLDSANNKITYSYLQTAIEACGPTSYCSRFEIFGACNGALTRGFMLNGIGVGCFASTVCSSNALIVSKNGSDTIAAGAFISLQTATGTNYQQNLQLGANGSLDFWNYNATSWNKRLTIASTGLAEFACSILTNTRLGVGISSDQNYASIFVGGDITSGVNQYAIIADPQLSGTSNSYALFANARIKASTAVTNAFGVYIPSAEKLSGASIANNYALYIANQTSGASVNYSIYSSGGLNYFGGSVTIGTSCAAFGRPLTVASDIVAYFSAQESISMGISNGTGAQSWGIQVCDTGDGSSALHLNARGGPVGINIGAGNNASYPLHVNGTAYATGAAGALSDCRRKQCIQSLSKGLSEVMRLNPVQFEWKNQYINDCGMVGTQLGFIAQEVIEILPSSILVDSQNDDTLALKINEFIPILTKAIQEQQCTICSQASIINTLKTCIGI